MFLTMVNLSKSSFAFERLTGVSLPLSTSMATTSGLLSSSANFHVLILGMSGGQHQVWKHHGVKNKVWKTKGDILK